MQWNLFGSEITKRSQVTTKEGKSWQHWRDIFFSLMQNWNPNRITRGMANLAFLPYCHDIARELQQLWW